METFGFHDGNVHDLLESRHTRFRPDINHNLQMHSSLIQRLSLEYELEGHIGCVNTVAWNSSGSLLISGSDDTRINIWSYPGQKLLHSIDTGHSANIFCTKFVHETSDELVASGAGDAEVRLFNLSRVSGTRLNDNAITPSALYQCHTKRVKKLAVEVGNPNVIWSASEDGTLRQHDFREGSSCPPAGSSHQECRNVLDIILSFDFLDEVPYGMDVDKFVFEGYTGYWKLDLRCGAKSSLADPPKQALALKSCDISSIKPHFLMVGGSDAFARLYDRRMLPSLSSSQRKQLPPQCVNYFCPMHLSERGHSSLLLTHVTFSPNGEEVLLSYSGEHVYLMNLDNAGRSFMQYSSGDFSKIMNFSPMAMMNGMEFQHHESNICTNGLTKKKKIPELEKCKTLVQTAKKCLEEDTNYLCGIEACNEILDGYGHDIGTLMKHDCLCTRAALLLKRKWKNDYYMAIRDCYHAWRIDSSSFRAHSYMSEALSQMGKHKEALDFAIAAQCLNPSDPEVGERVNNLEADLAAAEAEKSSKINDGTARSDARSGRILTLSDILYRSDANSDASLDGPMSERDDSEYDEEVELDFETSISGYDTDNVDSNIVHGSLNLRMHRRVDSSRDSGGINGSCGSLPSSSQSEKSFYQPEFAVDMKMRYVGHCNIGTDIKQASFLGQKGEYVASGSDDGRWFIWEKRTGRLVKMLMGDGAVVNCVQCHPFDCAVATSGIDNTIKMWTPSAPISSIVAGGAAGPETADVMSVIENNQRRLLRNREAFLPFEIIERLRMHEFSEGSLHPFECAQS